MMISGTWGIKGELRNSSMESIFFKRWSNKKYAVLHSFHKIIHIGTLALSSSLLQLQPVLAQSDTASPRMFFDLEEVETISEQEAELYSPLLRQLLLIGQEQIDIASSRSLADLLDYYPGVDIRTRGSKGIQSDLNIQGGSFDQSLVLLNGIDLSDPQTGHFNLDLPIGPFQVKKIELLKGPASKKYGPGAYTGAINFITEPADSLSIQAEVSYGQFNTYNASGTFKLPIGITRTTISSTFSGSDGYQQNTDFNSSGILLHSVFENRISKIELISAWNKKLFGANAFYTPRFPEQYEETSSLLGILKFESKNSRLNLSGNLYWKRHYDHFLLFRSNPEAYENYHLTDVLGGAVGKKISSSIGITSIELRFRHEQILSTSLGDPLEDPLIVKNSGDALYDNFKDRNHLTASVNHLARIGKFYFSAGMMVHSGIKDLIRPGIYPGIDISWIVNDNISLFTSANRSMRLPTFTDLYYQGPQNRGNPGLEPEKAVTFEKGLKYSGESVRFDVALFYRLGKETIDWIWTDSTWQTSNLTDLNTYGTESGFTFYPAQLFSSIKFIDHVGLTYTYTALNKSSDAFISNYALDNLRHKFVADLKIKLPFNFYIDGKISWQDRNGSFLYYETPASVPVDTPYGPFFLADINAGVKLKSLTIFLDATNIMDKAYRDIGSVVMPGRWLMAGIRFR